MEAEDAAAMMAGQSAGKASASVPPPSSGQPLADAFDTDSPMTEVE